MKHPPSLMDKWTARGRDDIPLLLLSTLRRPDAGACQWQEETHGQQANKALRLWQGGLQDAVHVVELAGVFCLHLCSVLISDMTPAT